MPLKPEWIAFGVNLTIFTIYLVQWREPGKIIYWGAAVALTVGLLKMQG